MRLYIKFQMRGQRAEKNPYKIHLETGRHHQIRVQMAHAGMPLLGDRKYNPGEISQLPLGLCSCHLIFRHPITGKKMEFQVTPNGESFAGFPNP